MAFGLLGERLSHSHSPLIYRQFGMDDYRLFEVPPTEVEAFLRRGDLQGLNVTIPYKKTVLPHCHTLSEAARRLGNVNTLLFDEAGRLHGHNTDYTGLRDTLERGGFPVAGRKVVVLGTGGAAQTAAMVAGDLGAAQVVQISRSGSDNYQNLHRHADAALLINATPVGMYPHTDETPVSLDGFPALLGVVDLIYNPLRTRLLAEAQERGIPAAGGLFMLAGQGRAAAELFLGRPIPREESVSIHAALLGEVESIVLVGMPGSGKSAVGMALARLLGRPFRDTDQMVEEKTGRTPAAIIEEDGEEAFRQAEAAVVALAAREGGIVLATGGGAILRAENRRALRQNGRVYWLKRSLESLEVEGRPLSKNLPALYEKRRPLYEAAADVAVEECPSPQETADRIVEEFYEHTRSQWAQPKPSR